MNRNSSLEALVLSTRAVGEDNRIATILSPRRGLFSAMVYGGRKGKLRSTVSPYHSGTMWIYSDVVKDSIKVTDFDPMKCRPEIRNNLYKACAAALCAELVIKTHGLGSHGMHSAGTDESADDDDLWVLVNGFLDGLDVSSEDSSRIGTLRFLWRYIGLMGLQSDCSRCMHCGSNMVSWYSAIENVFSCADCVHSSDSSHSANMSQGNNSGVGVLFYLGEESVDYLRAITTLSPRDVRSKQLHAQSMQELHELLYFLIRNSAESKLKTLDAGRGIL